MIEIDNTRRTTFQTCPRKYFYRWVKNMVPQKGASALRFGHAIHEGLAVYYDNFMEQPRKELEQMIAEAISKDFITASEGKEFHEDHRTLETALTVVLRYIDHYISEKEYIKILEVEYPFTIPIGDNIQFIGRIDGIIDLDGGIYAFEHKTTALALSWAQNNLYRSAQVIGYAWAITQKYDSPVMGCLVNFLQISRGRARKDGSYPPVKTDFGRFPQIYTPEIYNDWMDSILHTAYLIQASEELNEWPMQFDGCYIYNGQCPYTALCQQHCSLEDINYAGYVEEKWDPRD